MRPSGKTRIVAVLCSGGLDSVVLVAHEARAAEVQPIYVAVGLAWTPTGGDVLFVEATRMQGGKQLLTTGQLGDVMKESARAALSYAKSHLDELGINPKAFDRKDIHIHVPEGAIKKDGPSAGVAMVTSLVSLTFLISNLFIKMVLYYRR
jgi:ATP-dependent Lon protease